MGATTLPETNESGPPVAVRSSEGLAISPALPRPYYADDAVTVYHGDALALLPLLPSACCCYRPHQQQQRTSRQQHLLLG